MEGSRFSTAQHGENAGMNVGGWYEAEPKPVSKSMGSAGFTRIQDCFQGVAGKHSKLIFVVS